MASTAGLDLRRATEADAERIVALSVACHGREELWGVRTLLESPDDPFCIVADGDEVVSMLCLMDHRFRLGGVELPAGQVEYVATHPDYRNRGLIRALMDEVHRWSDERGHLFTVITGIPYYYRLFGYEYGLEYPPLRPMVPTLVPPAPEGWDVRLATHDDVETLRALHAHARQRTGAELVHVRRDKEWGWLLHAAARWGETTLVASRDGVIEGYALVVSGHGRDYTHLRDVSARSLDAVRALVSHAASIAIDGGTRFEAVDRPGTELSPVLDEIAASTGPPFAVYARVADPVAFLDHIRPVLSARLAASRFAAESGRLDISQYRTGIALHYERGEITGVEAAPPDPDADEHEGVGIPPNQIATLLLGRFSATELEARVDDVVLGRHRQLMQTLFPRVSSDIGTVL